MTMSAVDIARVTHEANRAYCISLGDYSQKHFEQAPEWQRKSAIEGVQAVIDGRAKTPEQQHQAWLDAKVEDGWTFGSIKNEQARTHPCMVPYSELPPEQRRKDHIFRAVVVACLGEV